MAANLSPLAGAAWQFFSNSGLPLAGGKLYTYLAGSTTPQASYTSSTGLVANTNPIILNSAGRLDNEVWLPEGVSYKFVLNTSLDVTLGTYDNIAGINDFATAIATAVAGVYASFSGSSGSSLVGYIASGTGAVAQTVQSKLRQTFNVKDYGAVGDGVTDDTLAIQRTITASDGVIIIPAGTFMITGITLTAGKQLIGLNRATSILKLKTALAGNGMINATNQANIVVENLTIDGGSLVGTKNSLINFYGCDYARIENNNFINTDQFAVGCNSMQYYAIRGNVFLMSQHVGAWIDTSTVVVGSGGPVSATGLVGTISAPTGAGGVQATFTYSTNSSGAVVPSSISFSTNGRGYIVNPTASFPAVPGSSCTARYGGAQVVAITCSATTVVGENVEISHNYLDGGGCNVSLRHSNIFGNVVREVIYGAAFVSEILANVGKNVYSNNVVTRIGYCTVTGASYTNTYIGPDTDNTVNSGFELWGFYEECSNNICYYNAASGISFGARGGICTGNTVYDNGQYWATTGLYTTRGIQIPAGNVTYNGSYSLISNNRCFDQNGASGTQGYGIGADNSTLVGLKIVDNDCFGNRTGSYDMQGATVTFFRGRRIEGRSNVNPASIASGGAADYAVTVPGLDTGNWLLSANFVGLTTEPMMLTTRYTSSNTASVRLFNFSGSAYDLPTGNLLVQGEEVIA